MANFECIFLELYQNSSSQTLTTDGVGVGNGYRNNFMSAVLVA